jgi:hypothetical protein
MQVSKKMGQRKAGPIKAEGLARQLPPIEQIDQQGQT